MGRDEPGKICGSIGSRQTTFMPTLIFLQRIWVGTEAAWASWMQPLPCTSRCCSWNSLPTAEPTKYILQEKAVGAGKTLPLLFLELSLEEKSSSAQREKLSPVLRLLYAMSVAWSSTYIHGGTPSGALRSFPILLSSWEILEKNWAQNKQHRIHRTTAFYNSSHLWLQLPASSDCTDTQDIFS